MEARQPLPWCRALCLLQQWASSGPVSYDRSIVGSGPRWAATRDEGKHCNGARTCEPHRSRLLIGTKPRDPRIIALAAEPFMLVGQRLSSSPKLRSRKTSGRYTGFVTTNRRPSSELSHGRPPLWVGLAVPWIGASPSLTTWVLPAARR